MPGISATDWASGSFWSSSATQLAAFARPLLAFAGSWQQVLAIRLGDRVGKGIRSSPRDAMIADTVRIEQRGLAFGFHRAMDHSGAVVGPIIGYALAVLFAGNFTQIFLVAAIPVLAVLVALFVMRESPVVRTDKTKPVKLSLSGFDSNFKNIC